MARKEGTDYVLNGSKTYISGVEDAEAIDAAQTSKDESTGRGRLSLFIVDADAPGLSRTHIPTGITAPEKQWTLFFDDVRVGDDRMIGGVDQGLEVVFDGLNPERIAAAVTCTGVAQYALDKASQYARERTVWGKPIGRAR